METETIISKELNGKEYLFVQVPHNAISFELDYGSSNIICHGEYTEAAYIETPEGRYKIIDRASKLTENQWEEIVEKDVVYFYRYKDYTSVLSSGHSFATTSGKNLLASLKLNPDTTLIIQKC